MSQSRDPVADELAIRRLVNHHTDATSRRSAGEIAANFTADGEWVSPTIGRASGEKLRSFFAEQLEGWNLLVQGILSGRVHLDPADADRASGRWFIFEFGQRENGTNFVSSGVYHDDYVRESEGWRFARRRYDSLMRRAGDDMILSEFPTDAPEIG